LEFFHTLALSPNLCLMPCAGPCLIPHCHSLVEMEFFQRWRISASHFFGRFGRHATVPPLALLCLYQAEQLTESFANSLCLECIQDFRLMQVRQSKPPKWLSWNHGLDISPLPYSPWKQDICGVIKLSTISTKYSYYPPNNRQAPPSPQ
jgi:hypothetical protein